MVELTERRDDPSGPSRLPAALGRRRPTGEPPPLPRHVSASTRVYVAMVGVVALLWLVLLTDRGLRERHARGGRGERSLGGDGHEGLQEADAAHPAMLKHFFGVAKGLFAFALRWRFL